MEREVGVVSLNLRERIAEVQERIAQAARRAGRRPEDIVLVGITKGVPPELIDQAFTAGVKIVGENRVQEMLAKIPRVTVPVEWHFVGTLQTNKVRQALGKVSLIHSLDRISLAEEIVRIARKEGITARVLVQVNASQELTKRGLEVKEVIPFLADISKWEGLKVEGLMTIAPAGRESEARRVFSRLRELAEEVQKEGFPGVEMRYLSMGMTDDFEVAIEEGSNMVRIGKGIFGPRF